MTSESRREEEGQERVEVTEVQTVSEDGVTSSFLRGLFWPFGLLVRTCQGLWRLLGFRAPIERVTPSPARHSLTGRKRLRRATRLLLSVLPRWLQSALGYPVSSNIGLSLSPELKISPTKPHGKGNKRKQDELDDDDEDEDQPTWVEVLSQELADDVDSEEDPEYEPSSVETESEEYASHNNTGEDLEVSGEDLIKNSNVDAAPL